VEKDRRFLPPLHELEKASQSRMHVVLGDCLTVNEKDLLDPYKPEPNTVKIIGNLPFGVATPLLLKWMRQVELKEGCFQYGKVPMVLLFQKEVADVQ
jgi:dimethyladenosine transferase 1